MKNKLNDQKRRATRKLGPICFIGFLLILTIVYADDIYYNLTGVDVREEKYPRWSAVTIEDLVAAPEEYMGRGLELRGHAQLIETKNMSRYYMGYFYDSGGNYREWTEFVFEYYHCYYLYGRDLESKIYTIVDSNSTWTLPDSCGNDPISVENGTVTGCTYLLWGHLVEYGEYSEEGKRYYFDVEDVYALTWGFPPELYGEVRTPPANNTVSPTVQIQIGANDTGWEVSLNTTTEEPT